jgi:hypothetical protein
MWLVVLAAGIAPRVIFALLWISGERVDAAFDSVIWPILGLIFLPSASILYVLVWEPAVGVTGYEWIIVGGAAVIDVIFWATRLARAQNPY